MGGLGPRAPWRAVEHSYPKALLLQRLVAVARPGVVERPGALQREGALQGLPAGPGPADTTGTYRAFDGARSQRCWRGMTSRYCLEEARRACRGNTPRVVAAPPLEAHMWTDGRGWQARASTRARESREADLPP